MELDGSDKYHRNSDICHSPFSENKLKCLYKQRSRLWRYNCEFYNNQIFLGSRDTGLTFKPAISTNILNINGGI